MRLSPTDFDQLLTKDSLRISFIGMSNIGKSYTAQRIERAHKFQCFEIDTLIQKSLAQSSISNAASWMGHPFEPRYTANARQYLELEKQHTDDTLEKTGNIVVDTTGSVIYLPRSSTQKLTTNSLCIYIKASKVDIKELVSRYGKFPKPTIWGDIDVETSTDNVESTELQMENLMTNYPKLLHKREALYDDLADIHIDAHMLADRGLNDHDILPLIRDHLTIRN
jgi:shikimate kinase